MKTLVKLLLERNLIPVNSVIGGRVRARTLGGIQKVRKDVYYHQVAAEGLVCRDELGTQYLMQLDDVASIDGMDVERFARVYNIKPDGSRARTGKKRGRKPKTAVNNCNGGLTNGKNQRANINNQTKSTA